MKHYILLPVVCLLLGSCSLLPDKIVSPGRILRDNLSNGLLPLYETCNKIKSCQVDELEIIGHGAGSYRYYPMDIHKDGYIHGNQWNLKCQAKAKDINPLIDQTFATKEIRSVEIDIQAPPADHILCKNGQDCLFIMHNKPDWDTITSLKHPVVNYLQRNTLGKTLRHFINKGYYKKQRLYLEIKSSFGCNAPNRKDSKCKDAGLRIASEIKAALAEVKNKTRKQDPNWLTMISFSATALQSFRQGLPKDLQDSVNYTLIAGVHPFSLKWFFGQAKGSVPLFTDELQQFATTTPWLDYVWFSPQGISKFSTLFHDLTIKRQQECKERGRQCHELRFNVSTYALKQKTFYKAMTEIDPPFTQILTSMMIDVDDVKNCR